MTSLQTSRPFDYFGDQFVKLLGGDFFQPSASAVFVSRGNFTVAIVGEGLTYGANDMPTGGVINEIQIRVNEPFATIAYLSGFELDVADFRDALDDGKMAKLLKGLFDGDDFFSGSPAADRFEGGAGDDVFRGGPGKDVYDGGKGFDLVDYSQSQGPVTVNMLKASGDKGDAKGDTLKSIESILGSGHDDRLTADDSGMRLNGWEGSDTLTGGKGADEFEFSFFFGIDGVDVIKGFKGADDQIRLDTGTFDAFFTSEVGANNFVVGKQATTSSQFLVYDKKTGALYYDEDGAGGAGQVQFATISNKVKLTHEDFDLFF